ncbi:MAG: YciI family protein [Acidobacteriia bacterium]|nr:YciI family protein [Terriglobia bacterium]
MKYLLLIYGNEAHWDTLQDAERMKIYKEFMDFSADLKKNGKYVGGNELKPIATATTVRVRDGKRAVTDGPFAETKEQLGGYYLVDAKDLDEALGLAARIPSVRWGSIEVRPINPHDDM